jgi:lysozyme
VNVADVSLYQGSIDWAVYKAAVSDRAIVKLSEGVNITDPTALTNCEGARAAGLEVEGYHFGRLSSSASMNASLAIATAKTCGVQRVWLDFEDPSNPLDPDGSAAWALAFLNAVEAAGLKAGFYTYSGYVNRFTADPALAAFPLWLANYGPNNGLWPPTRPAPSCPAPWTSFEGWQHTSVASVPGIAGHVDMSLFTADIPPPPAPESEDEVNLANCIIAIELAYAAHGKAADEAGKKYWQDTIAAAAPENRDAVLALMVSKLG